MKHERVLQDTSAVSVLTRAAPCEGVVAFLSEHEDFWLSVDAAMSSLTEPQPYSILRYLSAMFTVQ